MALSAGAPFALAGCGEDEDRVPMRSITLDAGRFADVTATEYYFDPVQIIIRTRPGREDLRSLLQIHLQNDGELVHDLRVLQGDVDVGGTRLLKPGDETRTAILFLEKGKYRFVCTVGDHEQQGMSGRLIVR